MSHNIEVSIEVDVTASVAFWVDKAEWEALSPEAKQERLAEVMLGIARRLDDDILTFPATEGSLAMTMTTPIHSVDGSNVVDLNTVEVYDPGERP